MRDPVAGSAGGAPGGGGDRSPPRTVRAAAVGRSVTPTRQSAPSRAAPDASREPTTREPGIDDRSRARRWGTCAKWRASAVDRLDPPPCARPRGGRAVEIDLAVVPEQIA